PCPGPFGGRDTGSRSAHAAAGDGGVRRRRFAQSLSRPRRPRSPRGATRAETASPHPGRSAIEVKPAWPLSAYTIAVPHMTPEEAVAAVKEAGYDGIEWSVHVHDREQSRQPTRLHRNDRCFLEPTREALSQARKWCEHAGLQISGLGLGGQFN